MSTAYLVFAQRADAYLDVDAWATQAARFFASKLGAMTPRARTRETAPALLVDAVDIVLLTGGNENASGQVRRVSSRATETADLAAAERAESRHPGGLLHLARRCGYVYEIARDADHADDAGEDDRQDAIALRLAAIVASVVLGPIVDPARVAIFGVKTARARLEADPRR